MVFVDAMNIYESLGALNLSTNVDYYKFALKELRGETPPFL